VWYLCDAIISVCAYLEENEIHHGDIRPCNILLSEEGFAKIYDHGVMNDLRSGYIKMLAGSDRCYLSPDLLLAFAKREFQPAYNIHKADVFSFGMTLLYATTLSDPFYCYDFLAYKIINKNKEELLNKTNSRYSLLLTDFIRKMLEEDDKNRPTFRELYSMLIPHQESIRQMQSIVLKKILNFKK
jgi:serine/threonine protein kinase